VAVKELSRRLLALDLMMLLTFKEELWTYATNGGVMIVCAEANLVVASLRLVEIELVLGEQVAKEV
jgi:hypothetical protein